MRESFETFARRLRFASSALTRGLCPDAPEEPSIYNLGRLRCCCKRAYSPLVRPSDHSCGMGGDGRCATWTGCYLAAQIWRGGLAGVWNSRTVFAYITCNYCGLKGHISRYREKNKADRQREGRANPNCKSVGGLGVARRAKERFPHSSGALSAEPALVGTNGERVWSCMEPLTGELCRHRHRRPRRGILQEALGLSWRRWANGVRIQRMVRLQWRSGRGGWYHSNCCGCHWAARSGEGYRTLQTMGRGFNGECPRRVCFASQDPHREGVLEKKGVGNEFGYEYLLD